ncbi:MAG: DEAD/DEAH box helicase, partial [Pseudomonadota bacterium]|nr:DEAD/DEAH box helicase [Pseudomonadota bacterium]
MTTPVTTLSGVTPRVAALLARLGIETIDDLLFHLPLRYEDKTYIRTLDSLMVGEAALIEGVIQTAEVKVGKRRTLVCVLTDGHAQMMLRFFHFYPPQRQQLQPGVSLRCFGEVRQGPYCLEMVHPEYQLLTPTQSGLSLQTHLTPIYPSTEGLQQNQLRALIDEALATAMPADYLPAALQSQFQLIALAQALHTIHHPPAHQAQLLEASHQRLAFEELLAQHLSLYLLRARVQQQSAPQLVNSGHLTEALLKQLPFQLTAAQKRVYTEIAADLRRQQPMQRLVQGDVGAGKTVVAALSALQAIESGYQVAVMAPTELLAEQHQQTLNQWLTPLDIHLTGLTGRLTKKKRQQILEHISRGDTTLVVGTHALLQKQVEFARLGLII